MRWVKIVGLLLAGAVTGGALAGYGMFEYMTRFGVEWNRWAAAQYEEMRASDALMTLGSLKQLRAGDIDGARRGLEQRLTTQAFELVGIRKSGYDPNGDISKTLSKIRQYRQANPWSSGSQELDKMVSDALVEQPH